MKILFLTQTNATGASARYRVYQYQDYLKGAGFEITISPAVDENIFQQYNQKPNFVNKIKFYGTTIIKRLGELEEIEEFDIVFLQRDIIIHLYPMLEKLIRRKAKKLIFDFDDALYEIPRSFLSDQRKIERIIRMSSWVIAGNRTIAAYAGQYTDCLSVIPTSVDLNRYPVQPQLKSDKGKPIIGWIGSDFTYRYLEKLKNVFLELSKKHDFIIRVIGVREKLNSGLPIEFRPWILEEEIAEINDFDIGIMPLSDDAWSAGKSGTKLSQYGAGFIPSVCSPVGINQEIVKHGQSGYWAKTDQEWVEALDRLLSDKELRLNMGKAARRQVEGNFSIQANAPKLIEILRKLSND